jgi:hypothetical protein
LFQDSEPTGDSPFLLLGIIESLVRLSKSFNLHAAVVAVLSCELLYGQRKRSDIPTYLHHGQSVSDVRERYTCSQLHAYNHDPRQGWQWYAHHSPNSIAHKNPQHLWVRTPGNMPPNFSTSSMRLIVHWRRRPFGTHAKAEKTVIIIKTCTCANKENTLD